MRKKLFLFPGQGSQEVGMGRDLFRGDDYFCSLIDRASAITGEDLKRLCLQGPEKKLLQARYLQPLVVAVSLGYLRHMQEKGVKADFVLGHSLGEITALAAAGVIDDKLAIAISAKRGELMDASAALCSGSMMAVLSIEAEVVRTLIDESGLKNKVFIANDNAPQQVVVSGDAISCDALSIRIVQKGGITKRINVLGPWHSPYISEAYEKFKVWVEDIQFMEPQTPIILNATGRTESDPAKIKESVALQLCNQVYFKQCMEYCKDKDMDVMYEIGPGRVLSGLVRANGFMQQVRVYSVNNLRGVESAVLETCARASVAEV